MKRLLTFATLASMVISAYGADPLRVFIRAGQNNRGKEVHAHPRFLEEWKPLLAERGMKVDGALDWPTAEQLKNTDVVLLYAQEGGDATPEQEAAVNDYLKRGGGLVVLHTAAVSMKNPGWWREVLGGAWKPGTTKWKEGPMDLYFVNNMAPVAVTKPHPITVGASNFHLDDEIYYDMDVKDGVQVLATSYTPKVREGRKPAEGGKAHIYDIQPQMWAYENTWEGGAKPYRAVTSIPGHLFKTFALPNYRAVVLRSLSWAANRDNVNEYVKKDEIDALTYPPGGPQKPADTLKNLEIHPDFKLTLVAAEPLINKPMNFDWAPDGSLWVAETPEYPNGRRGMRPDYRGKEWKDRGGIDFTPGDQERKALDKISRLVDTDGDGVMDKKEVFYEGLDLVTGLVFHKDGVIVTQAPDILWLRDTNGDGKADKVETLYSGLGTGDTHAVINNPRWGWDGWIYATHGYSGSGNVKNAKGEKQPNIGSGVVRFKPDGSAMEQYSSKGGNTWGLQITADNRVMWTQPTSGELLMQTVLPEYALARGKVGKTASYHVVEKSGKTFPAMPWEQLAYVQIDWVGSFTASAGTVIYDGGSWPAEYNGDYFTTEPTINIIHHAKLTPQGSSYTFAKQKGREETEFIRSKDMWWRPIEVRVGPDGAVYVGDFYNQAVIHNDTRGPDHNKVNAAVRPDRDHYFGRIWRLDHKDAKKIAVPNLAKAGVKELVAALEHPNRHVRMNVARLLLDRPNPLPERTTIWKEGEPEKYAELMEKNFGYNSLKNLAVDTSKSADARVAAMWILGHRDADILMLGYGWETVFADKDGVIRRNAAQIAELPHYAPFLSEKLIPLLGDADATVRLAALKALGAKQPYDETAKALVAAYAKFDDDFQRSAAVGAASKNPAAVIAAALDSADAPALAPLVTALTQNLTNPDDAAKLAIVLAGKPASADSLKASILTGLGKTVQGAPAMTPELTAALTKLLSSGASAAVLPLAAKWDKAGALKGATEKLIGDLFAKLDSGSDNDRLAAAQSLLGLRNVNDKALPAVAKLLADAKLSGGSKAAIIAALSETGEAAVGPALIAAFATLDATGQAAAFDAMLKRSEWTNALLDSVKAKTLSLTNLGPANIARLRTHPDPAISKRAAAMLEELNPMAKAKNEAIAKLSPVVESAGGDIAKGKAAFTTTCAICHVFDGQGKDIGPGLTGMGSHGPGELLTAIVDPNREVDPSFVTWNFELKNGQFMSGIIARENPANIIIRSLAGEQEIKVSDIKARTNTGRSLMPEGFEGLGAEAVRDIIAYMASVDGGKFRTLDLRDAYTATTARGLYLTQEAKSDTFVFSKHGTVNVGSVPFNIVAPEKSVTGNNIMVLKGGPPRAYAKSLPQKVDVKVGGFKANRLHFLGGVTGWGFQNNGDTSDVLKVTIHSTQGQREALLFKNGTEFSDYYTRVDVPGSKFAEGLVTNGRQMRWFSKQLAQTQEIDRITIESFDGQAVPTIVAITAELADANAPLQSGAQGTAPAPQKPKAAKVSGDDDANFKPQFSDEVPQPPATKPANGPRVLIVGGGSSHDFVKYFGGTDKETLKSVSGWVDFTQNLNGIAAILDRVDVLVLSANQPIASKTKKALIDYANRGGAIIAHHPGTWYAWGNFPQWNKEIIGGGTRGHDSLGAFPAKVANATHPITKGVPADFEITDELYNYTQDPEGTPIEVLVTATSPKSSKVFPQVFIVKHPKAKIVGFTLGHDARAHDLPAYQTLLKNAVQWVSAK